MKVDGRSSYDRLLTCQRLIGNGRIIQVDFFGSIGRTIIVFEKSAPSGIAGKESRLTINTDLSRRDREALAMLVE